MMKNWLYYLLDEKGYSYTVVNGAVVVSSSPKPLRNTPDGWDDILIGWEREMEKGGLVTNFSFPLGFVLDGAHIIRQIIYTKALASKLFLLIQKLEIETTPTTYRFYYKYFYKGQLELPKMKDTEFKVSLPMVQPGIAKQLKSNENTVYDLKGMEPIYVRMDGLFLYSTGNFTALDDLLISRADVGSIHSTPLTLIGIDGEATGIAFFSQEYSFEPLDVATSLNYFAVLDEAHDGNLRLWIKGKLLLTVEIGNISFRLVKNTGNVWWQSATYMTGGADPRLDVEVEINTFVDLAPGERVFLVTELNGLQSRYTFKKDADLTVSYESRMKETLVEAWRPITVFKALTAHITGSDVNCQSDYLTNEKGIVLTCGDAVRGIKDAYIKTSLQNFREYTKVVHACGFSVYKEKFQIEPIEVMLNTDNPTDLGNAKGFETTPAEDLLVNEIEVGYKEKDISGLNGKYEFNNTSRYTTPFIDVTKKLSLLCPYAAQPYYIESLRINLEGKTTTDNQGDNEVMLLSIEEEPATIDGPTEADTMIFGRKFFLFENHTGITFFKVGMRFTISDANINNGTYTVVAIVPLTDDSFIIRIAEQHTDGAMSGAKIKTSVYNLKREVYDEADGLPLNAFSAMFNIERLTPRRLLELHKRWINSVHYGFEGEKIKFQTTERNTIRTKKGLVEYKENGDVVIGPDRYFLPFYHQFNNTVPADFYELIEDEPNTPVSVDMGRGMITGILMKAGVAPDTGKEQTFKILSSPDNDLTLLI